MAIIMKTWYFSRDVIPLKAGFHMRFLMRFIARLQIARKNQLRFHGDLTAICRREIAAVWNLLELWCDLSAIWPKICFGVPPPRVGLSKKQMADVNNMASTTSKKISTSNSKPSLWRYSNLQHCVTTKTQSRHLCLLGVCACTDTKPLFTIITFHRNCIGIALKSHWNRIQIAVKSQLV